MASTNWMDKESARIAETEKQAEERGQQQLAASITAQQGAPEYWKQFVDEARVQTAGLEKRFTRSIDEKIVGWSTVEEPTAISRDHSCTVTVTRHSVKFGPEPCALYFHYQSGATQIKRSAQGQSDVFLDLHAGSHGMVADVNGSSMTAKQLAVYIVKGMYERVKFPE